MRIRLTRLAWLMFFLASLTHADDTSVNVGSKKFTESVLLGELSTQIVESRGVPATHRRELGGTRVLWNALLAGDIDIYPEYTGTITHEILAETAIWDQNELKRALAKHGILMSRPLGFNNTYALGMKAELAEKLGIRRISDLKSHPELALGFSNEFIDRSDGWPGLSEHYSLAPETARGLDHDLAYRALQAGTLQVIDLYSTDAEIPYYELRVLQDDLHYFPDYQAVWLYRADLLKRAPQAVAAIKQLELGINEQQMSAMNARAKIERVPEAVVAADFLQKTLALKTRPSAEGVASQLWRHTSEHLALVAISLSAAILVAIPLGILAWFRPRMGQVILGTAGVIQTIPALALLVFMIPLLGIGGAPAIVALFLYSLLPIIRNTYTGLHDIRPALRESAEALGLPTGARLRLIELPLASRAIIAGIKTSAVINVGTATLGALIGAGGYGQPILTGIRLDDTALILQGAVPAALLALSVQGLFEIAERFFVPKGLRVKTIS